MVAYRQRGIPRAKSFSRSARIVSETGASTRLTSPGCRVRKGAVGMSMGFHARKWTCSASAKVRGSSQSCGMFSSLRAPAGATSQTATNCRAEMLQTRRRPNLRLVDCRPRRRRWDRPRLAPDEPFHSGAHNGRACGAAGRTNRGGKRPQPAKPRIIDPRRTPWHPPNGRAHDRRIVAHASGSEPAMVRGLPGKKSPCSFIKSARQGGISSGASFNNQCPPWPVQGAAASTTQRCQRTLSACISSAAWLVWTKTRSHCCRTSGSGTAVEKSQIGTFGIPSRK